MAWHFVMVAQTAPDGRQHPERETLKDVTFVTSKRTLWLLAGSERQAVFGWYLLRWDSAFLSSCSGLKDPLGLPNDLRLQQGRGRPHTDFCQF